jgi:hypothetical protein
MTDHPNWFKFYREQHNIPEIGCVEDNELVLVTRETLRLALHAMRWAIAEADDRKQAPHRPSLMAKAEISGVLAENTASVLTPTAHIFPTTKRAPDGQHQLRGAADVRPIHEEQRVRKSNRWTSWLW